MIGYVLRRAGTEEQQAIEEAVALAADELPRLFAEGAERVMNRLHARPPRSRQGGGDGTGAG